MSLHQPRPSLHHREHVAGTALGPGLLPHPAVSVHPRGDRSQSPAPGGRDTVQHPARGQLRGAESSAGRGKQRGSLRGCEGSGVGGEAGVLGLLSASSIAPAAGQRGAARRRSAAWLGAAAPGVPGLRGLRRGRGELRCPEGKIAPLTVLTLPLEIGSCCARSAAEIYVLFVLFFWF